MILEEGGKGFLVDCEGSDDIAGWQAEKSCRDWLYEPLESQLYSMLTGNVVLREDVDSWSLVCFPPLVPLATKLLGTSHLYPSQPLYRSLPKNFLMFGLSSTASTSFTSRG